MSESSSNDKLRALAILVVDDHAINREFLRAGLEQSVTRLDTVASGPAAIERCRRHNYDVILMDLHMPQMDGLTTAHRIRDLGTPSARARIVVLTADTRPEERLRLLAEGVDAYLNKPLSITHLKLALQRLFEPARAREPSPENSKFGTEPLIDPQRAQAANLGDMLSRELREKLPELDRMMAEHRIDEAAALLHQWTGASGFAGAPRLSRSCSELRRRLLAPAASSIGTAYADFLRTAQATRQAIEAGLSNHA